MEITLKNDLAELARVSQRLNEFGAHQRLGARVLHDLHLALEEILANIISYGYADDREHEITVSLHAQPGEVRVDVEDDGRPFNPLESPEPYTGDSLDDRPVGGLGIHLVRALMDGLEYRRRGDRNLLTMKKTTQD